MLLAVWRAESSSRTERTLASVSAAEHFQVVSPSKQGSSLARCLGRQRQLTAWLQLCSATVADVKPAVLALPTRDARMRDQVYGFCAHSKQAVVPRPPLVTVYSRLATLIAPEQDVAFLVPRTTSCVTAQRVAT